METPEDGSFSLLWEWATSVKWFLTRSAARRFCRTQYFFPATIKSSYRKKFPTIPGFLPGGTYFQGEKRKKINADAECNRVSQRLADRK
jgi:hypothetical protein